MKNEIKEELEKLSPELIQTGNRNPFVVPEGYWEQMKEGVYDSVLMDREDLSVPSDYFDTLTDRVITKAKSKNESKIISFNFRKWIAAASVVIFFFAGYLVLNNTSAAVSTPDEFALDIDIDEAFDYLEDQDGLYLTDVLSIVDEFIFSDTDADEYYGEGTLDIVLEDLDEDQLEELY